MSPSAPTPPHRHPGAGRDPAPLISLARSTAFGGSVPQVGGERSEPQRCCCDHCRPLRRGDRFAETGFAPSSTSRSVGFPRKPQRPHTVIPAQAGIQCRLDFARTFGRRSGGSVRRTRFRRLSARRNPNVAIVTDAGPGNAHRRSPGTLPPASRTSRGGAHSASEDSRPFGFAFAHPQPKRVPPRA